MSPESETDQGATKTDCVSSLADLAKKCCIAHAHQIYDVGDVPYSTVRPILLRVSAKQLNSIETNSPKLKPYTNEIWLHLLHKDFSDKPLPKSNNYRKAYAKLHKERQENLKNASLRLRESLQAIKQRKAEAKITSITYHPIKTPRRPWALSSGKQESSIMKKVKKEAGQHGKIFSNNKRTSFGPNNLQQSPATTTNSSDSASAGSKKRIPTTSAPPPHPLPQPRKPLPDSSNSFSEPSRPASPSTKRKKQVCVFIPRKR